MTVAVLLAASVAISYVVAQQGFVPSNRLYRIAVSPDAPPIQDTRFNVVEADASTARELLDKGAIDAYVDEDSVLPGHRPESQFAVGALQAYLEKQELTRLVESADIDRAFPLRLGVERVATTPSPMEGQGSPADLTEGGDSAPTAGDGELEGAESHGHVPSEGAGDLDDPYAGSSDTEVRKQIERLKSGSRLPDAETAFGAGDQTMIPSLMQPPILFSQVVVAFLYVLPISFVSVFFTTSFMEEKTNRRISVLLSAPLTPFHIIVGKMLPYVTFSVGAVVVITLVLGGRVRLSLAIFLPVILFIFAVYLLVPMVYRTFKDTTFISMLATTVIVSYLVFPAMFSGVNDLAYMSPLTLAVKMYRGEPFGLRQYVFSTASMYLVFALAVHVGTRVLNEEFLMGFRPLYQKAADAVYLSLWHDRPYLSVALLSAFLVPIVFAAELVALAISLNLPMRYAVAGLLVAAIVVEEVAKSVGIVVLLENRIVGRWFEILGLSFLSAAGFMVAEKLLLLLSLRIVSESLLSAALFSSGMFLMPLLAHFVFTALICELKGRFGVRYGIALVAGSVLHLLYDLAVLGVLG